MDGLVPGRIVYYVLSGQDAREINRRRTTGVSIAARIKDSLWPLGAQAHIGNEVHEGDVLPAQIIMVWSQDSGCSNLKVNLDGTDAFWGTSRNFSADKTPGMWSWMYEGQQTRGQAK